MTNYMHVFVQDDLASCPHVGLNYPDLWGCPLSSQSIRPPSIGPALNMLGILGALTSLTTSISLSCSFEVVKAKQFQGGRTANINDILKIKLAVF